MPDPAYLVGLEDDQKRAVLSDARASRIIAAAGSGKTRTITAKIHRLLAEGAQPRDIVAFTFTEKAAEELKQRIYERVEEDMSLPEATRDAVGQMRIGTIHGWCLQLLEETGRAPNSTVLDGDQLFALVTRFGISEFGLPDGSPPEFAKTVKRFVRSVSIIHDELLNIDDFRSSSDQREKDFAKSWDAYHERLKKSRLLTFDLLIARAISAIEEDSSLVSNIRHLIVDEYQDINRAQEKLIRLMSANGTITAVGDPRQCIYEWRGSDPGLLTDFFDHDAETFQLSLNHRSANTVVETANVVARGFDDPVLTTPMRPSRGEPGIVAGASFEDERVQAEMIRDQIAALRFKGFAHSDIAVLLRSVGTSGGAIMDILEESGIPFTVAGSAGLFRADEARVLGMIFCWYGDQPWREGQFAPLQGSNGLELKALALWRTILPKCGAKVGDLLDIKLKLGDGGYSSVTDAFQETLKALHVELLDPAQETHAIRLENLGRFNTLLTDLEAPFRYDGIRPTWKALLKQIAIFLNQHATGSYEGAEAGEEKRGLGVNIMTIHQAKGLEWPVVFMPSLTERRFPSEDPGPRDERAKPDTSLAPDHYPVARYSRSAESMRKLFYVATTRAKDGLVLSWHEHTEGGQQQSPTGFLGGLTTLPTPSFPLLQKPLHTQRSDERFSVVSTTDVIRYGQCPRCYWLRSIGFQPGLREGIGYGRSIHAALYGASEVLRTQGSISDGEIAEIVRSTFHAPFASPRKRADLQKKATEMVREHVMAQKEALRTIREAEAHVETEVGDRIYISGRIDLVLAPDNKVEIRDYKTMTVDVGKNPAAMEDGRFQLQIYTGALRHAGEDVGAANIVLLGNEPNKQLQVVDITESAVKSAIERARTYAKGIVERKFSPDSHNPGCGTCDFLFYCSHCRASSAPPEGR